MKMTSERKKITIWTCLGLVGYLAESLETAITNDGLLSIEELIKIGDGICDRLGYKLDRKGFDVSGLKQLIEEVKK